MAEPRPADPVKYFVAVLYSDARMLEQARAELVSRWGVIDHDGPDHPFDVTDYYDQEMGPGLKRRIWAFGVLRPPEWIAEAKLASNAVEDALRGPAGRTVNLDVGYLDHHKVVLASVKFAGQKVHVARGIYADLVCRYRRGGYEPFEWTFPDFRDGRYAEELLDIRRRYLRERQTARNTPPVGGDER